MIVVILSLDLIRGDMLLVVESMMCLIWIWGGGWGYCEDGERRSFGRLVEQVVCFCDEDSVGAFELGDGGAIGCVRDGCLSGDIGVIDFFLCISQVSK